VLAVELSGQPLVAVDIDLKGQGEPGRQADVQQTKLGIEEVEIEHQAAAEIFLEVGSSFAVENAKGRTGFHGGEDRDQALGNALLPDELACEVFLTNLPFQEAKGSTRLLGQLLRVLFEPVCLLGSKGFEVLQQDALIGQEILHALGIGERQVPLEDQAIGAEQTTRDFVGVLV